MKETQKRTRENRQLGLAIKGAEREPDIKCYKSEQELLPVDLGKAHLSFALAARVCPKVDVGLHS